MQTKYTNDLAEKKVLSWFIKNPKTIFDYNGLGLDDFSSQSVRCSFSAVKNIYSESSNLNDNKPIDDVILSEKIAFLYPEYYKSQKPIIQETIKFATENSVSKKDFEDLLIIVLNNSVKRKYYQKVEEIKEAIDSAKSPDEVSNIIECSTLEFTTNLFKSSEIDILGKNFDNWLYNKAQEVKQGKVHVGIKFGFPLYERSIGGGFRDGTISIIASRAKFGKSTVAMNIANNVAKQGIPVLYLDTELDDLYQTIRWSAIATKTPLVSLDEGRFFADTNKLESIKNMSQYLKDNKIHYVDIKGWTLEEQISIIRRFFAKIVGQNSEGKFNKCLVILDYLKLMNYNDKNKDKEWEALGYRMTTLHDLMGSYNAPMLAFAQQNRDGLEKEDESTMSGSDRIIWLCDNFTIFSKLDEVEVMQKHQANANDPNARKPENCKFKIVCSRHGRGTPGRKYISLYCDFHDPLIKEDEVCGIIEERCIQTTITIK